MIREAVKEDLQTVMELLSTLDNEEIGSVEEVTETWEKICTYPYYKVFIVEIEKEIAGTYSIIIIDNLGHKGAKLAVVENVTVSRKYRRQGIGRLMMLDAMEKAKEQGCYKLMLSSDKKRLMAHKFYKKLGFKQHGISFIVGVGVQKND